MPARASRQHVSAGRRGVWTSRRRAPISRTGFSPGAFPIFFESPDSASDPKRRISFGVFSPVVAGVRPDGHSRRVVRPFKPKRFQFGFSIEFRKLTRVVPATRNRRIGSQTTLRHAALKLTRRFRQQHTRRISIIPRDRRSRRLRGFQVRRFKVLKLIIAFSPPTSSVLIARPTPSVPRERDVREFFVDRFGSASRLFLSRFQNYEV